MKSLMLVMAMTMAAHAQDNNPWGDGYNDFMRFPGDRSRSERSTLRENGYEEIKTGAAFGSRHAWVAQNGFLYTVGKVKGVYAIGVYLNVNGTGYDLTLVGEAAYKFLVCKGYAFFHKTGGAWYCGWTQGGKEAVDRSVARKWRPGRLPWRSSGVARLPAALA